jgi:hypothetical protein
VADALKHLIRLFDGLTLDLGKLQMIEARFEFQPGMLTQLVSKLLALPAELRPSHHSLGEDEKGQLIKDREGFVKSLIERSPGPYLTGDHCSYDISLAAPKPIICHASLDVEPSVVRQLMVEMASLKPIFGFACAQEERYQRNRVTTQQGVNKIESWVGRDTQKYLPGFYWLTLLSDGIAQQHGISFPVVEAVAQEHVTLENGQHLFRFYQRPEEWSATSTVAQLCASLSGVFDVEKVTPQLQSAKNFLELSAMLKNWK